MVFFVLTFCAERYLRHTGRLASNNSKSQKALSTLSIIAAVAGSAGLILLSIFDTYHHKHLHDGLLVLFIGGYILSAIFLCAEYQRLGIHYRGHRILRISFWMKLAFILVEACLAVAFGVCGDRKRYNGAAVCEWIISLIFSFYILSFLIDLLPSVRTKHHVPQGLKEQVAEHEMGVSRPHDYGEPLTSDSAGPNQNVGSSQPNMANGQIYGQGPNVYAGAHGNAYPDGHQVAGQGLSRNF